jgi:TPR repeat protein
MACEAKNEISEAIVWYRKAAQQGESSALTNLGLIYGLGQNVMKNEIVAYGLLEMAVMRGNETALDIRDTIAKSLTPSKMDEAKALAHEPEKLWALMDNN